MQFVQRVLTDLTRCKTPADYYKVQIDINRNATPRDLALLSNRPIPWPNEFDDWLDDLAAMAASVRPEPAPFQSVELDRTTTLYTGEKRAPGVVVAFCGKAGLLFVPIALILQYLTPGEFDLLLIREAYKDSENGTNLSFAENLEKLGAAVGLTRYREIRTLGTSAGGAAALAAGVVTGATRAISFSGHLPSAGITYRGKATVSEVEQILRGAKPATRFSAVYGAENRFDAGNAMALSKMVPLHHYAIPGVKEHNVVFALHKRNELAKVFTDVGLT